MAGPKSSKKHKFVKAWVQEHVNDHYVQEAKRLGYRARAAFKLIEVDARDRLLRGGQVVVDLGSAPGSWSQVAAAKLRGNGTVIALDLLPMQGIAGVEFIEGDFSDDGVLAMDFLRRKEPYLEAPRPDLILLDLQLPRLDHRSQA